VTPVTYLQTYFKESITNSQLGKCLYFLWQYTFPLLLRVPFGLYLVLLSKRPTLSSSIASGYYYIILYAHSETLKFKSGQWETVFSLFLNFCNEELNNLYCSPEMISRRTSLADGSEEIHFSRFRGCDYRRVLDWMIGFIDTLYTPVGTTINYSAIADLHTLQFTVTHALGYSVFTSRILATDL
jgi:hypothetical protein